MTRIAIIVGTKGRGSNMRAIIEACQAGALDAEVILVIAPSESSPALAVAAGLGVSTLAMQNFDRDLLTSLVRHDIDLVCLAGFMRLIPRDVVEAFEYRMLNVHPALLPKFGGKGMWGMKVHEAVIASGDRESGCTVHFVSERYDEGDVLHQLRCPVLPDDTPETLAARVLELEHRCYVEAIELWISHNS
jgi:formyltetrahydrofolate-dependent phosphoribosylglycinamide formyltransferase